MKKVVLVVSFLLVNVINAMDRELVQAISSHDAAKVENMIETVRSLAPEQLVALRQLANACVEDLQHESDARLAKKRNSLLKGCVGSLTALALFFAADRLRLTTYYDLIPWHFNRNYNLHYNLMSLDSNLKTHTFLAFFDCLARSAFAGLFCWMGATTLLKITRNRDEKEKALEKQYADALKIRTLLYS